MLVWALKLLIMEVSLQSLLSTGQIIGIYKFKMDM